MFFPVLLLAAAATHPSQIMAGRAFERFARYTDRYCPSRELRSITPGDLSWEQETFEKQLRFDQKRRLASLNQRDQRCAKSKGGLACLTSATLDALWRAKMLPAFGRFTCMHLVPVVSLQEHIRRPKTVLVGGIEQDEPFAAAAAAILRRLDLNSFSNSTGPRWQPRRHTPADYGLTKLETFDDGWAQASEPDDGWHMAVFLLDGKASTRTICFTDAGGRGTTYRATQALRVTLDTSGRWTAVKVGDQVGCRNSPTLDAQSAARLVHQVISERRAVGGVPRVRSDVVRLEHEDDPSFTFSVHVANGCLPGQPVCSTLIGHYRVEKATGTVLDADRDPG